MNKIYRDLIFNLAKRAVMDATSVKNFLHSGLKGQLRELFVKQLLQPMLPREYIIGSGNIISAYDQVSRQIDVIVCDRRIIPPLLFEGEVGIFPIESVILNIEVKSRLNLDELRKSHESASEIQTYKYCFTQDRKVEGPPACIFAFDTDLEIGGKTEIERYQEMLCGSEPTIRVICVVGRGCWHFYESGWRFWEIKGEYSEIVSFMIAITNSLQRIASTRSPPNLEHYVDFDFSHKVAEVTQNN